MPLEDLQLSTKTWAAALASGFRGFGSGCFLTMLVQPEIGAGLTFGFSSATGAGAAVSSMVACEKMEDKGGLLNPRGGEYCYAKEVGNRVPPTSFLYLGFV